MAQNRLSDLAKLINQQMDSQETLTECLSKANALIRVALGEDFLEYENFVINDYLWALSDFIEQARSMSERQLNVLLRNGFTEEVC